MAEGGSGKGISVYLFNNLYLVTEDDSRDNDEVRDDSSCRRGGRRHTHTLCNKHCLQCILLLVECKYSTKYQ